MSLFYGYESKHENLKSDVTGKNMSAKLSTTGDTMTGNIDMGSNKISTTADPTNDKDLSRKKYVDDQIKNTAYHLNLIESYIKFGF